MKANVCPHCKQRIPAQKLCMRCRKPITDWTIAGTRKFCSGRCRVAYLRSLDRGWGNLDNTGST